MRRPKAALQVRSETGLDPVLRNDGAGEYWIDSEVPTAGDEVRAVVTLNDVNDWEWIGPTHVLPRLQAKD